MTHCMQSLDLYSWINDKMFLLNSFWWISFSLDFMRDGIGPKNVNVTKSPLDYNVTFLVRQNTKQIQSIAFFRHIRTDILYFHTLSRAFLSLNLNIFLKLRGLFTISWDLRFLSADFIWHFSTLRRTFPQLHVLYLRENYA